MGGLMQALGLKDKGKSTPTAPETVWPEFRLLNFSVYNTRNQPMRAVLIPDFHAPIEGTITDGWRVSFRVPRAVVEGAEIMLHPAGKPQLAMHGRVMIGGRTVDELGGLPHTDTELDQISMVWPVEFERPRAWTVDGQFCREAESGAPVREISASFFAGFQRFLQEGPSQDLTATVGELRQIGFNTIRVFLSYNGGLGKLDPRGALDFLPAFWGFCADQGMRVHQTIFADTPSWLPDQREQEQLFFQVYAHAVNWPGVRLEGVNEGDDARNRAVGLRDIANTRLPKEGPICSHGSTIQDGGYLVPTWHVADYHPARGGADWSRRPGHNAWEDVANKCNIPVFSSEIKRPDEADYDVSGFYEAGANVGMFCAGGTFHSNAGKAARRLSLQEYDCAEAFVDGVLDVPMMYQRGSYAAGHLSNSPVTWSEGWQGRAHAKIVGNQACVVLSGLDRGQHADEVKAKDRWAILERRGRNGQVILLAR